MVEQIALRIDPGQGRGHHQHVHTGGKRSKFGIDHRELPVAIKLAQEYQIEIVGLHAHAGNGISDPDAWPSNGSAALSIIRLLVAVFAVY